jgi:hypothetical protein
MTQQVWCDGYLCVMDRWAALWLKQRTCTHPPYLAILAVVSEIRLPVPWGRPLVSFPAFTCTPAAPRSQFQEQTWVDLWSLPGLADSATL